MPCFVKSVIFLMDFHLLVSRLSSAAARFAVEPPLHSREIIQRLSGVVVLPTHNSDFVSIRLFNPSLSVVFIFAFTAFSFSSTGFLCRSHRFYYLVSCDIASRVSGHSSPKTLLLASTSCPSRRSALCRRPVLKVQVKDSVTHSENQLCHHQEFHHFRHIFC